MRAVVLLTLVIGCAHAKPVPYRLTIPEKYEVGEDATVVLDVKQVSDDDAKIIVTRPDGTVVKEAASLEEASARIRFGKPPPHPGLPPTFTIPGEYKVELEVNDNVEAKTVIVVKKNLLDELLPMADVGDYKQITRYTRPKIYGKKDQGKSYGAIYTLPWKVESRVEITIDDPGKHLKATWKTFEEEGAVTVMDNSNVIFRERAESVTASWFSDNKIIRMQAPTLADLEKDIIGFFLSKFPSKLEAK